MEYLTIAFIARDQNIALTHLIHLTAKTQCYIEESRISALGSDFAGIVRVAGNWNAIAKLEATLATLKENPELMMEVKRTAFVKQEGDFLPYLTQVVALDTPDLVHEVTHFFSAQAIHILDLQTDPFKSHHSETTMITVSMRINIPAELSIADLRERFMILCDELNIDGIIEPEKR